MTIEENGRQLALPLARDYRDAQTEFVRNERMELSLSRHLFEGLDAVHLRFEIASGDQIIQTLPGYGALLVDMAEAYAAHWFV